MKQKTISALLLILLLLAGAYLLWDASDYLHPAPAEDVLTVRFLDVGQGDAALITCDGHAMLIDGGGKDASRKIHSILQSAGLRKLDLVIASHPHEDHIGGLAAALQFAPADLVLCTTASFDSESFRDFAKYARSITVPQAGSVYPLGRAKVEILGLNAVPEENDSSMFVRVSLGKTSFLFTGDAEAAAEEALLASDTNLSADVLKVAHHGSSTGTSAAFLSRTAPRYAVISLSRDNLYGHPHASVLSRLQEACRLVYRTDLNGEITFTSDGKTLSVKTERLASERDIYTPGIFPGEESPTAIEAAYIGNANSRKFHLPECSSVPKIKPENRREFSASREQLIASGYSPCGNCHP